MRKDEILAWLSEQCANTVMTADCISEKASQSMPNKLQFVPYEVIQNFIEVVRETERYEEEKRIESVPIKQFLYVEDGSVDTDNLITELKMKNPEIKVIVYRQGSERPQLTDMECNNGKNNNT